MDEIKKEITIFFLVLGLIELRFGRDRFTKLNTSAKDEMIKTLRQALRNEDILMQACTDLTE